MPYDLERQSIIGTYLSVVVTAIDGNTHTVELYADTSAGMFVTANLILEIVLISTFRMGFSYT